MFEYVRRQLDTGTGLRSRDRAYSYISVRQVSLILRLWMVESVHFVVVRMSLLTLGGTGIRINTWDRRRRRNKVDFIIESAVVIENWMKNGIHNELG